MKSLEILFLTFNGGIIMVFYRDTTHCRFNVLQLANNKLPVSQWVVCLYAHVIILGCD